jgi:hypothetical protein
MGMFRMWRFPAMVALLATILTTTVSSVVLHADATAAGGPCGPPVVNAVACENTLPGDPPSDWKLNNSGDSTIQGFATAMSLNAGQTENFKVQTTASAWHMNILRLGYYGGDGARLVATNIQPSAPQPQTQPACLSYAATGLIDCGNWAVSASWAVPSTAVSGYYLAELVRNDTGGKSEIPFVVRNDGNHSDIVYEVDDATQEAYNTWGGNSLYQCAGSPPPAPFSSDTKPVCPPGNPQGYQGAFAVSYNRPWHTADDDGQTLPTGGLASGSWFTTTELPMIEFLEGNGYDVSYIASTDLDADGSPLLANHKIFMDSGHDEYWSGNQRAALQTAINGGLNAAFFSGNEMFWKTRYGPSQDGTNTPERTLITYKETHFNAPTDPEDPPTWTGAWADPRFSPPADGGLPSNATTGQYFQVNYGSADLVVPAAYAKLSIWRNTAVAKLTGSQTLTLDPGADIIGYEWDSDSDNGFRPAGEFDLSKTVVSVPQAFDDYGTNVAPATITHSLSLYRAPSGALVFGAGTVQFSWGLVNGTLSAKPADPNMQQMVVNLFAEMAVQPATLFSGLVPGSSSTDTTPPSSTITSPPSGSTLTDGSSVTITGTAADAGGGMVSGVEVSTDDGKTWHPVTSMSPAGSSVSWSYSWVAHGSPTTTILSRAVDDSGNLETPGPGVSVNVNCPCSIWGNAVTPTTVDGGDASAVNLGVKFTTDTFGTINGIRFYKAAANTGTHVGSLWSSTGQLLAQATFTGETASGWQQVTFSNPVPVLPGTTYVASYFAPKGHYSDDVSYFYGPPQVMSAGPGMFDSPPLHALHGPASVGNGVFTYASSTAFPDNLDQGDNYYVDVVYTPSPAPGPATNVTVTPGFGSASVSWTAPTGGSPVTTYTITPYLNGVQQPTTTVGGSPAATTAVVGGLTPGLQYTFTVTASNPAGAAAPSAQSPPVTPLAIPSTPTYVQAATAHTPGAGVLSATTPSGVVIGARMIVTVGMWASNGPTVASVTDSAGDTYTEVTHFTASDKTDESIWTAPVTNGGGPLTVTVTPTGSADIGLGVQEYAGLSPAAGLAAVDQSAHATGKTSGAATVSSGATPATTVPNDLALGSYVDSGFGDSLTAGSGFTPRANVSPSGDIEFLMEDAVVGQGATPAATFGTGASTTWLASIVDFLPAPAGAPTPPGAPTNVTAVPGNGQAVVSWQAPASNGGSLITSYVVTASSGQTATVNGVAPNPPATSTTLTGLTNGVAVTFTVQAVNGPGTGPASSPSPSVTPTAPTTPVYVQAVSAHKTSVTSVSLTPGTNVTAGNRLVVMVGIWGSPTRTAKTVTDSAGNTYTELLHFSGSDKTELSIWSAPITAGGGTKPAVKVTASGSADVGATVLEYAGLSSAAGAAAVDQLASATGTTSGAATVSSGPTAATTAGGELAIGFYSDSGFGDTITTGSGFTSRVNVSATSDMEFAVEDQTVALGSTPNASFGTGANTPWLVATVDFKHA